MASRARNGTGLLNPSTRKSLVGVRIRAALLVVAVLASAGLLYWQVQNIAVISAFVALVVSMTAIAYFLRPRAEETDRHYADPGDWAVTRMVADQSAGRTAWRDGRGYAEGLKRGVAEYSAKVVRAGQGEEYLLWQMIPQIHADILDDMIRLVSGGGGRAFSESGILASVIGGRTAWHAGASVSCSARPGKGKGARVDPAD